MSDFTYKFSELLTKAIHQIKADSSGRKKIRIIQDEIGYALGKSGGSCIEHWRKGNLPASLIDLERLTQELVVRGGLSTPEEIQLFLVYGGHPKPDEFHTHLFANINENLAVTTSMGVNQKSHQIDWGTCPNVDIFYGRKTEQTNLIQWILAEECRLIAILGFGGVGKTALTAKVAHKVSEYFDVVIWRSLLNAPPLTEILGDYIQFLSHNQQKWSLQTGLDRGIGLLINLLHEQRCLLILDNIETIFKNGDYDTEHKGYGQLIRQLGEGIHRSCLLLTSREKPPEIVLLAGPSSPVRVLNLDGLDSATGQALLQNRGLHGTPEDWYHLIERYSGNPFALKVAAETVREPFSGDIAKFLKTEAVCFDSIQNLLEQQFRNLDELEMATLYWLAIEREPITSEELHERLYPPTDKHKVLGALNTLRHRSLIEISTTGFTLQNVAMEYLTVRLVNEIYSEIINENPTLLDSHALLLAQAENYVREMQLRLILNPLAKRLLKTVRETEIKLHLKTILDICLLYTSPSPRDRTRSRMPSSA